MMIAEDTLPQFQVALADKEGQMWVCYRIESGVFQDYVFMLTEGINEFKWLYGMLEKEEGSEIKPLNATPESINLAIDLMHYFNSHRHEILANHTKSLYNRG